MLNVNSVVKKQKNVIVEFAELFHPSVDVLKNGHILDIINVVKF